MDREKLRELAAEVAQGSASAAEHVDFLSLLAKADRDTQQEIAQLIDVAALLSLGLATSTPAGLRERVLAGIKKESASSGMPGLTFVFGQDQGGWIQLPVAGASFKVLSVNPVSGYVVALGKLGPGVRYPSHTHIASEQIFVLSGDLVIGDQRLQAGDFHEAAAGSTHPVNYSETGCTILAVLSQKDLEAQLAMMK